MPLIPEFFKRAIRIIDPSYYVIFDSGSRTFDIMKDIKEKSRRKDGSYEWTKTSLLLAFFKNPNDKALTRLRERKWLGRRLSLIEHPKRYMEWCKRINAEAKAMKSKLAADMLIEGFKKIHKHRTSKTVDYGGVYDESRDKSSHEKFD